MPVFKLECDAVPQWTGLVDELSTELTSPHVPSVSVPSLPNLCPDTLTYPPAIYEEGFPQAQSLGVIVVWDRWAEVPQASRGAIIIEAYRRSDPGKAEMVRFPVGVTYDEARSGGYLPFVIEPSTLPNQQSIRDAINDAMLAEGGRAAFSAVELRFPYRSLAEASQQRLEGQFGANTFHIREDPMMWT
jgi:hypothetical protein